MKQSWGELSCWNLCAHVMWDLFCQWWDHSTQGPAPGAISYCVLLPAQACCHGIAASTCLLEEENKKAAIWCVVLILQGLFSPFFMFFWLLQFPSSLLGHLGTEGQLQDAERLRQILAKLPFTKNNLILFFFSSFSMPTYFLLLPTLKLYAWHLCCLLLFVGVLACTLNTQTLATRCNKRYFFLLPCRMGLCPQPVPITPSGLFQPAAQP